MSYAEFIEWVAFAEVEPLPAARADLHAAMSMWLLVSINRKKGAKVPKLESFLLDYWQDKRDPRRLEAKFRALTAHLQDNAEPLEPPEKERVVRGENGRRT